MLPNPIDQDLFLLEHPSDLISLGKWQKTVNLLSKLFHAPAGFLVQHTSAGFQVTISSEQSSNPYSAGVVIESDANIFCRRIVETGQALYVPNAMIDPCWDTNPEVHQDGFRSYLGVPVFWPNKQPFGTFCVMDYKETEYSDTYIELIEQLKDILESDLSLMSLYQQMQTLAITDSLTAINNRRGFTALAHQRILLAKRMNMRQALLYFDIDEFKVINDKYGHGVGDKVLIAVAQSIYKAIRRSDVVGRLGGDEFVALVVVQSPDDIRQLQKRILTGFEEAQRQQKLPDFTVSIGDIEVDLNLSFEELLDRADHVMMEKKAKEP
ncbi:sensor domain-containing diguanylate cyclase [Corallincola luteus]|uniref:diguanylate cyclase n=1 Tax=Corallincola luteus TaxID=1775177 RepID=A0ABY2AFW9_9GAMM|nr:sensor domain-containing diguanylate cyclase [Corallincola luteus]